MQENKKLIIKRAAKTAAFTVAGGVAFLALGDTASADVVVQDSDVTNTGIGVANSGGNVAVGNASQNTAGTGQVALGGGLASNVANTSNESDGSAAIVTGDATGTGNSSSTEVEQKAATDDGPGLDVVVQDNDVTNAGIGVANSGGNIGIGNVSQNNAITGQFAAGFLASNIADTSNSSDGTAGIVTGDASGVGNQSATKVKQDADTGDGPGLDVIVQSSDVDNLGIGLANTGGNIGIGNASQNSAATLQGAFGFLASNIASTKNSSNGGVFMKTGNASAAGNVSETDIEQAAHTDGVGPNIVWQPVTVTNAGIGAANSGSNVGVGNVAVNAAWVVQVAFGPFASNIADTENWSDGFVFELTGDATAVGNHSTTGVKQYA
jgi:hypothetical protein